MRAEIFYWRLSWGREIDFIVERKPNVYPLKSLIILA